MNLDLIRKLILKLNSKSKPNISKISQELRITRKTFENNFKRLIKDRIVENFTININPNIEPNLKYVILEIKTNMKSNVNLSGLSEKYRTISNDELLKEYREE